MFVAGDRNREDGCPFPNYSSHLLAAHIELQGGEGVVRNAGTHPLFGLSKFQLVEDSGPMGNGHEGFLHSYSIVNLTGALESPAECFESAQGWVSIWDTTDG